MKIDYRLLPVKAHFFFFMAASGPILPFLTVYGKQLGISEVVMGSVTAILPIIFLLAKPVFGFIVDYFHKRRKVIFMCLVLSMGLFYTMLYLVPHTNQMPEKVSFDLSDGCDSLLQCSHRDLETSRDCSSSFKKGICNITCLESSVKSVNSLFTRNSSVTNVCLNVTNLTTRLICNSLTNCKVMCSTVEETSCFYQTFTFYGFIVIMCLGMIAYNVANSVSDAICFDMLGGGNEKDYGKQRVWGAVGFGITALLGGLTMDLWSGTETKDYTPAFVLVMIFTIVDLAFCYKLELPKMGQSSNILKDMGKVLKHKHIITFLIFATFAGVLDSFIIYFMFWFLEDLAIAENTMANIKFLEGLTVAAETLGGELIFFPLSGKIIEKIGFGHSFTLCFFMYAVRLGLISLLTSPWWIVPIEFFMQGPTYALCYTTIVAYASAVSPPGTSATMQGLVAGMDDGFGYAIGSLIGGFLYRAVGGRTAFRLFCFTAIACGVSHYLLYRFVLRKCSEPKSNSINGTEYSSPTEAIQLSSTADS